MSAIRHGQVLLAQGKNILARESQRQSASQRSRSARCCSRCCSREVDDGDDLETGSLQAPLVGNAPPSSGPELLADADIDSLLLNTADGEDFAPDSYRGFLVSRLGGRDRFLRSKDHADPLRALLRSARTARHREEVDKGLGGSHRRGRAASQRPRGERRSAGDRNATAMGAIVHVRYDSARAAFVRSRVSWRHSASLGDRRRAGDTHARDLGRSVSS